MSYAYVPLLLRCRSFTHTCRRIENENSFLEFWPKGNLSYFYDFTYIYFCVYSSRFFGLNTKREMCVKRKSIRNCDLPTVSHTRHCALLKFPILSFCFFPFSVFIARVSRVLFDSRCCMALQRDAQCPHANTGNFTDSFTTPGPSSVLWHFVVLPRINFVFCCCTLRTGQNVSHVWHILRIIDAASVAGGLAECLEINALSFANVDNDVDRS